MSLTKKSGVTISVILMILLGLSSYFSMSSLAVGNESDMGTVAALLVDGLGLSFIIKYWKLTNMTSMCRRWIVWIIWMLIMSFFYNPMPHGPASFLHPIYCPIVFLLSYILAFRYDVSERIFKISFLILALFLSILCILYSSILASSYSMEFYASNMVFYPLCCLPFIFLVKDKRIKFAFIALLCLVVLYCQKRSATIVFLAVLAGWLFTGTSSSKNKFMAFWGIVLLFLIMNGWMGDYLGNMTNRLNEMNEDQGSGRVDIWNAVIKLISDNDLFQWVFGRGEGSIVQSGFPNAHNDALQLLYEFGLPGLIFYVIFLFKSMKSAVHLYKEQSVYYMGYFSCVCVIIVMGMVSNLFVFYSFFSFICAYMGMVEAVRQKTEISI